jgi:hypothetical protein
MYFSQLMRVYDGLIMLAALFLSFLLSGVLYDCSLIKVNRLAACITLSVVGAALAVILGVGVKFAQFSSQCEARAKYIPITLLRLCKLALTARNTLFAL